MLLIVVISYLPEAREGDLEVGVFGETDDGDVLSIPGLLLPLCSALMCLLRVNLVVDSNKC